MLGSLFKRKETEKKVAELVQLANSATRNFETISANTEIYKKNFEVIIKSFADVNTDVKGIVDTLNKHTDGLHLASSRNTSQGKLLVDLDERVKKLESAITFAEHLQ